MKKKLIEVALPLDAINAASSREKSIRHGHPSTLHLWWARRPLAACRAVLFASLVDDPSSNPDEFPTEEEQEKERQRLFRIIEDLVKWESTTDEKVLNMARQEILKSTGGNPPPVYDPFTGGGSIPLEAQRLGLKAYGSDLNPVPVLITKALIEIPPRFAGNSPVNPKAQSKIQGGKKSWKGATGLAEDVRYYGELMRDMAFERIGHLYPEVEIPDEDGGGKATVIAWLWARTVKCPNPACGAQMPLASSFWLSKRKGREAFVEPIVDKDAKTITFEVHTGKGTPVDPPKIGRGANFRCLICDEIAEHSYIQQSGQGKNIGNQLMTVVAEGSSGRTYISPNKEHREIARISRFTDRGWLNSDLPDNTRWFSPPVFGFDTFGDLFTDRQLIALTTFSDLVNEIRPVIREDAINAGMKEDETPLNDGGSGAQAYADAVATYLAFAVDRLADRASSICSWDSSRDNIRNVFARQAIPMTWDFAEGNPFSNSTGNFLSALMWITKNLEVAITDIPGVVTQHDATKPILFKGEILFSTDPPYYDNIGYADLSDFFYVWMRRSLKDVYPDLFTTLLTPKSSELIASRYRFEGSQDKADEFFEVGLQETFVNMAKSSHFDYPTTIFYAFKQAETKGNGDIASTGWETMLEGLISSGYAITGTWPMRTELSNRAVARGTNALASSIVLVCRPRPEDAQRATRRDFVNALKRELPEAIRNLQHGNIAPVDMAQAAIGPGIAIYSRYRQVLESDGTRMPVRTALALINRSLDELLSEQEGDFDADTRWALSWFEQFGFEQGLYGDAETLARAKNTSTAGLAEAGIIYSGGGKVRLLKREELQSDWDPQKDERLTVWEITQYLVYALSENGEGGAARLLAKLGAAGEVGRDLAYQLYNICERKNWAQEAIGYNALVVSWPAIQRLASEVDLSRAGEQGALL